MVTRWLYRKERERSAARGRSVPRPGSAIACVLLLAGACISGCAKKQGHPTANHAPALQKIRFVTDWYPQAEHGGYYNALVRGYYSAAGLDVEILPGNPRDSPDRRVASGGAQFGMSGADNMLIGHERGLPLVAVTTTFEHDPQAVMVHADSPVKSFADLSDHHVSVGPGAPWFRYILLKYHLHNVQELPLTFTVAEFVRDPTWIQQAFVTADPYFAQLQGIKARLLPIRDSGYDNYRVLMANREILAKNPDVVRRFVAASVHGWTEYLRDPSMANTVILKSNPAMTEGQLMYSWAALKDGHYIDGFAEKSEGVGQMSAQRWSAEYNILKQVGVLKTSFDPREAYTLEFLPPREKVTSSPVAR
jgi:NitT/TauT family transport system substrate-binding protein